MSNEGWVPNIKTHTGYKYTMSLVQHKSMPSATPVALPHPPHPSRCGLDTAPRRTVARTGMTLSRKAAAVSFPCDKSKSHTDSGMMPLPPPVPASSNEANNGSPSSRCVSRRQLATSSDKLPSLKAYSSVVGRQATKQPSAHMAADACMHARTHARTTHNASFALQRRCRQ